MTIIMVELLVAGLIVVVVAVLAPLAWVARRREIPGSISEAQARKKRSAADDGDPGAALP